jgi:hypothetical protein
MGVIGERSLRFTGRYVGNNCRNRKRTSLRLTPVPVDLTLRIMGDKSPKATHKHAVQKQVKAAEKQKNNAASSKEVPKTKK